MLQLYRFFRGEKGLEQMDIYYQAHVKSLEHKLRSLCYKYTAFFAVKKV